MSEEILMIVDQDDTDHYKYSAKELWEDLNSYINMYEGLDLEKVWFKLNVAAYETEDDEDELVSTLTFYREK